MNVFIIPSWYPTAVNPIAGVFVKEQSMAVASLQEDINIIVAKWDNGLTYLPLKKPNLICKSIFSYIQSKPFISRVSHNYYEYNIPSLTWSYRLPFGGANRLIQSIESAFLTAMSAVGTIDIIHAHVSYPAGYIAFLLSKKFGIPYVITEHMGPFPFKAYLKKGRPISEIQDAFYNAKRTIAVSNALCQRIQSFGLPCSDVVPNVIDEEIFNVSAKKNNVFTFLTVCSISNQKGIDTLLMAIKKLEISHNIQFVIAGAGVMLEAYKKYSSELGIASKITWLGQVERGKVPDLFKQSHAYVMASKHETFGVVYAEAIACGLPVIATKCGGPEDIINEINGVLIPVDDVVQLKNAIEHIYNNYASYKSDEIREDFLNRFSRSSTVKKIVQIYEETQSGSVGR